MSSTQSAVASTHLFDQYQTLYGRLESVIPAWEWSTFLPYIDAIEHLKREKNALVIAHNYQTPEVFHGVADLTGDSLAMARQAQNTNADVIVVCGVYFMAETAKLLNPDKTVLIADANAGCSLAASITAADVRQLRLQFPGAPVVSYVNTSAAVKAESDLCCTSSNAVAAVESLGVDEVIFIPDQYLGRYVAEQTTVNVRLWNGSCEVHERFTGSELQAYRDQTGAYVLAHPECPQDVLQAADYVGSTAGMIHHLEEKHPPRVLLMTECSMSDNVSVAHPDIEFVRPCNLCPHMKTITLAKIQTALETLAPAVEIKDSIAPLARRALERMLEI